MIPQPPGSDAIGGNAPANAPAVVPAAATVQGSPQADPRPLHGARVFAVSKVRLDADGRVTAVHWGEVDTRANDWAGPEHTVPVKAAVAAIRDGHAVFALFPSTHGHMPERRFVAVEYDNGWSTIVLDGLPTFEREVHDMERLAD